jgi:carbonic anhydrase
MGAIDELLVRHVAGRVNVSCCDAEDLRVRPRLKVAVVCCMDSRINLFKVLGLRLGDAHVLRNAGGLATDDALRSLVLSQQLLGTQEVMVIQHTDCGLEGLRDADIAGRLEAKSGVAPPYDFGGFADADESVRASLERVRNCPWLVRRDAVRGFVYDVKTRELREVD